MPGRCKKPRENDLAERYRAGDFDKEQMFEVDEDQTQKYSSRNKNAQQGRIEKTALLRATLLVVGDHVRFRDTGITNESGRQR